MNHPVTYQTKSHNGIIFSILYHAVYIPLFPLTLAGYILWAGKVMSSKGKSGISSTAQGPLSARYFEHQLGTRQDEASKRLMMVMPNVSPLGVNLFTWPMLIAHRVSGYVPKAFRYPFEGEVPPGYLASARQTFFDQVVEHYLPGISQLVILGAGFDTRAFRLPEGTSVRRFEVDSVQTQALKRDLLGKAGINTAGVEFIPADFEQEDWFKKLESAGFDPSIPALFIWEGVTVYLDQSAVEGTLGKIARSAPGSILAFDYITTVPLESRELYWRYARMGTRAAGEPFKFGIDSTPPTRQRIEELVNSCGLSLSEQQTLGQESGGNRSWGGFAVAIVP